MIFIEPTKPHGMTGKPTSTRGYSSAAQRENAIRGLRKLGYNYFVKFADTQSKYALTCSWAEWVGSGCHIQS